MTVRLKQYINMIITLYLLLVAHGRLLEMIKERESSLHSKQKKLWRQSVFLKVTGAHPSFWGSPTS